MHKKWIIFGGCGFIGSHLVDWLLADPDVDHVTVIDNFSSGSLWHLRSHSSDSRLKILELDVRETDSLTQLCQGHQTAVHLASNPDISRSFAEPSIDFVSGTALTQSVLEACRRSSIENFVYASGSGVYGDCGATVTGEDHGPMLPTSTYGASKLAGEAMVCAYAHMYGMRTRAYRFANVVGSRQTHGVVYDFINKLRINSAFLEVLGNGHQSKPYVHVQDVVDGVTQGLAWGGDGHETYNLATDDFASVREIVALVLAGMGLKNVEVIYGESRGGWKGDVPVVRLSTDKLRTVGWKPKFTSLEALSKAIEQQLMDIQS